MVTSETCCPSRGSEYHFSIVARIEIYNLHRFPVSLKYPPDIVYIISDCAFRVEHLIGTSLYISVTVLCLIRSLLIVRSCLLEYRGHIDDSNFSLVLSQSRSFAQFSCASRFSGILLTGFTILDSRAICHICNGFIR